MEDLIEDKIIVQFTDNIPRVVHLDKNKAPRGAQQIEIHDCIFWVEECTYAKAVAKMYAASKNVKDEFVARRYENAMLKYVLDTYGDGTFSLMLYGFAEWHKYIDTSYGGPAV